MADNIGYTEGTEKSLAADEISAAKYERVKQQYGRNNRRYDPLPGTDQGQAEMVRWRPLITHAVYMFGNTHSAAHDYANGDAFSGASWELFRKRYTEGSTDYAPRLLTNVTLIDTDGTEPDLDLFVHTSAWNPTDGEAFAPPRTALERVCGVIPVATADWRATSTGSVFNWTGGILLPQATILMGLWFRFTSAQAGLAQTYRIRAHTHMEAG